MIMLQKKMLKNINKSYKKMIKKKSFLMQKSRKI